MAAFCIPPAQAATFKQDVISGKLDIEKMSKMFSADRRALLETYVGEANAPKVNALFESKLLLKDQQRGLANWAIKVAGDNKPVLNKLQAKIQKMTAALQPADEASFLSDFVQDKLGAPVTADEARQIGMASEKARLALADWDAVGRAHPDWADPNSPAVKYGKADQEMIELLNNLKGGPPLMSARTIMELSTLPQQMLTSVLHMSALWVQAANMIGRARSWQGAYHMIRFMANEENLKNFNAWVITHPDYELLKQGKVAINTGKFSPQEEYIQGHIVSNISHYVTGKAGDSLSAIFGKDITVPDPVSASGRGFTGFLNFVRAKSFYDLIKIARNNGEDLGPESRYVRDIGNMVNTFTGRGNIGFNDSLGKASPFINMFLWAPRKLSGTIGVFNPATYLNPRMSNTARMHAIKNLTSTLAVTSTVVGLAKLSGLSVSLDPDDRKFMQICSGETCFDMSGGDNSYIRMMTRVIKNVSIRAYDWAEDIPYQQPYGTPTALDTVMSFLRNKMTPYAGFVTDALNGSDSSGRPFSLTEEVKDKFLPITLHEVLELFHNDPDNYAALAFSPFTAFGIQMRTPMPEPEKYGMTMWGEPGEDKPSRDPVDVELRQIGYRPSFPPPNIKGVPLDGPQYREYIKASGENARVAIENDMSMPDWSDSPKEHKLRLIRAHITAARKSAADQLMLDYPEIMDKATELSNQRNGIDQ